MKCNITFSSQNSHILEACTSGTIIRLDDHCWKPRDKRSGTLLLLISSQLRKKLI